MKLNTSIQSNAMPPVQSRNGHVWGVARIGEGGDTLYTIQDDSTLDKLANVLLEPRQEAKTFKDPEDKDIIVTGEDLDILEAQKKVLDQARHHGDQFIINTAERNLDALKSAVSVNAFFVDASLIEDNPNYIKTSRHVPKLDADGSPAHGTPDKKRAISHTVPAGGKSDEQTPSADVEKKEVKRSPQPHGMDQFLTDVSTMFNDMLTQPDAFFETTENTYIIPANDVADMRQVAKASDVDTPPKNTEKTSPPDAERQVSRNLQQLRKSPKATSTLPSPAKAETDEVIA